MAITEQELRAMIRDAIARHASGRQAPEPALQTVSHGSSVTAVPPQASATGVHIHGSHGVFALVAVGDDCVIEPSRPCDHCGYCRSLGH